MTKNTSTLPTDAVLTAVRPSPRQLSWQAMEFYAFVHFGMNTMTDREWGLGHEDPTRFDPREVDVDQWMHAFASAGMTGAILTAKHHDGFCLWPSRVSAHTVAASPWRDGRGDLLGEFADAARRHGIRLGIYLSPWDRTEATYGTGAAYDDFFVAQLEEVLTGYGPVFSVWFDGANGEGANGKVQEYDWARYHETIRRLQPDAVINVCGPDVRWCGNEAGHTRANEWSVVPAALRDIEQIADKSQHVDDGEFAALVRSGDEDLGSRQALAGHDDDLVWYPAEVNTSIRPGWFYHRYEDDRVRSGETLFDLWCSSVGGNATFLLNVPPDPRGLVADPDLESLADVGRRIAAFRAAALPARVRVSSGVLDGDEDAADLPIPPIGRTATAVWRPDEADETPWIALALPDGSRVGAVAIREDIALGQRLEHVVVIGVRGGEATVLAETQAVGYQRILRFEPAIVDEVRVEIRASRGVPAISTVAAIAG